VLDRSICCCLIYRSFSVISKTHRFCWNSVQRYRRVYSEVWLRVKESSLWLCWCAGNQRKRHISRGIIVIVNETTRSMLFVKVTDK